MHQVIMSAKPFDGFIVPPSTPSTTSSSSSSSSSTSSAAPSATQQQQQDRDLSRMLPPPENVMLHLPQASQANTSKISVSPLPNHSGSPVYLLVRVKAVLASEARYCAYDSEGFSSLTRAAVPKGTVKVEGKITGIVYQHKGAYVYTQSAD